MLVFIGGWLTRNGFNISIILDVVFELLVAFMFDGEVWIKTPESEMIVFSYADDSLLELLVLAEINIVSDLVVTRIYVE